MTTKSKPTLSVVVPVYNEGSGISDFHRELLEGIKSSSQQSFEIIYIDDGSEDNTSGQIQVIAKRDKRVKLITLSRNFGKENALTAGIIEAQGQAILTIDGDSQHPVEVIQELVKKWTEGARVVVGVRTSNQGLSRVKVAASKVFYKVFNALTIQNLIPGSTDFRLIDHSVQQEFIRLKETDRVTRGLIDWLGFDPVYVKFSAKERQHGKASYSSQKLVELAINIFTSLTPKPLYLFGLLGIIITITSLMLGLTVLFEQILIGDPLNWNFTGSAMLGILILFMVGIILMSQGMLSLYISRIHSQTKQRPLYIIDYLNSSGIQKREDT